MTRSNKPMHPKNLSLMAALHQKKLFHSFKIITNQIRMLRWILLPLMIRILSTDVDAAPPHRASCLNLFCTNLAADDTIIAKEAIEKYFLTINSNRSIQFTRDEWETTDMAVERFTSLFYDTSMYIYNDLGIYSESVPETARMVSVGSYAGQCINNWPNGFSSNIKLYDILEICNAASCPPAFGYTNQSRAASIQPLSGDWTIYKVVAVKKNIAKGKDTIENNTPLLIALASNDLETFYIVGFDHYIPYIAITQTESEPKVTDMTQPDLEFDRIPLVPFSPGLQIISYSLSSILTKGYGLESEGKRKGVKISITHPIGKNFSTGIGLYWEQRNAMMWSNSIFKKPYSFQDTIFGTQNVVYTKIVQGNNLKENLLEKGIGVFGEMNIFLYKGESRRLAFSLMYNIDLISKRVSTMEGSLTYTGYLDQYNLPLYDIPEIGLYTTYDLNVLMQEVSPRNQIDMILNYMFSFRKYKKIWGSVGAFAGYEVSSLNTISINEYLLSEGQGEVNTMLGSVNKPLNQFYYGLSLQLWINP